jgi:hypothetical protein
MWTSVNESRVQRCAMETMEPRTMMSVTVEASATAPEVSDEFLPPQLGNVAVAPVVAKDWGDAPNVYRTTAAVNGPRHTIRAGFFLGFTGVDQEANGQPVNQDDVVGIDDEDCVTFPAGFAGFVPGTVVNILVQSSSPGMLDAWIDWGRDGTFSNATDRITPAAHLPLVPGANIVAVTVPAWAGGGNVWSRFRLSDAGVTGPRGFGNDGEVEDHGQGAAAAGPWRVINDNPNPAGDYLVASKPATNVFSRAVSYNGMVDELDANLG